MRIIINLEGLYKKDIKISIDNTYLELIKFLILNKKDNEIYLVSSDKFLEPLTNLQSYFNNYLDKKYFYVWCAINSYLNLSKHKKQNKLTQASIITNLEPDVIVNINEPNVELINKIKQINLSCDKDKISLINNNNILYKANKFNTNKNDIAKNIILTLDSIELFKDAEYLKSLTHNKIKSKLAIITPDLNLNLQTYIELEKFKEDLSKYYDVKLISNINNLSINTLDKYDRHLYIIDNDKLSYKTISLLQKYSGIVILLDFNLQNIYSTNKQITNTLYKSHGFKALIDYDIKGAYSDYPCNIDVLESSLGIISYDINLHSLLSKWYEISKYDKYKYIDINDYNVSDYVCFIEKAYGNSKYIKSVKNNIPKSSVKQLFVDVSEFSRHDHKTGIQRVVRNILEHLLKNPPKGYRVEPVYAKVKKGYFYARDFSCQFLNLPKLNNIQDDNIIYNPGDIFLGLDFSIHYVLHNEYFLKKMQSYGVKVYFNVNDLLPIQMPKYFPIGVKDLFIKWLDVLSDMDGVNCISNAVANDFYAWKENKKILTSPISKTKDIFTTIKPFKVNWFHLGANIKTGANDIAAKLSNNEQLTINKIKARTTFLMVSTIEPRKGYKQTLLAFEKLWDSGIDVNLVIVGKEGWKVSGLINKIKKHKELNNRLFWLNQISDNYLNELYKSASCLIVASEGEGFGLPVIEAQLHGIPVIARDLMVFREVSKGDTYYFKNDKSSDVMFFAIKDWLNSFKSNKIDDSDKLNILTWAQSADCLLKEVGV